jgi:hypothetical protein
MAILAGAKGKQSKTAVINISKGLSNLLAVPSINMFRDKAYDDFSKYDVYSTVKEVFGIWVKDSIPNIVDNSLTDADSRTEVYALLVSKKTDIEQEMDAIIKKAMKYNASDMPHYFEHLGDTGDHQAYRNEKLAQYESAFTAELKLTINTLISRLSAAKPVYTKNEGSKFGAESFPTRDREVRDTSSKTAIRRRRKKIIDAQGEGVRKDTFVNIPKGEGDQEQLHLAEIRNEKQMDKFLE